MAFILHSAESEKLYDSKDASPVSVEESERDVTYLTQHNGDIFEGEKIVVVCFSLRFYYARGAWLRLKWKNGTRTLLKGE